MADSRHDYQPEERENVQRNPPEGPQASVGNVTTAVSQHLHVVMPRKKSESESTGIETRERIVCPRVNCPEKIVICLDVSSEMDTVSFRSRSGDKFSPWKLTIRAIGMFVHNKHIIDPRHTFALVLLDEEPRWVLNFTHNPNDIVNFLDKFAGTKPTESCNLSSLFNLLREIPLPHVADVTVTPPPYVVRTLLMYGRSHCIPTIQSDENLKILHKSPQHFFLDSYYIHEPPSDQNHCERIFDTLCELDVNGLYYVFEVSRNPTKIYDCMAQLLAHPLQRPLQKDTFYSIEPPAAADTCG